jgi:hypothetical protein
MVDDGPLLPSDLAGARVALLRCPILPQDEASITHSAPVNDQGAVAENDRPGRCGKVLRLTGESLSWKGWGTDSTPMAQRVGQDNGLPLLSGFAQVS